VLPTGDAALAGGCATMTGDGDDEELEVVMGHPDLPASVHISLSEVMSMPHFVLLQA
jgi:hypothetical protein